VFEHEVDRIADRRVFAERHCGPRLEDADRRVQDRFAEQLLRSLATTGIVFVGLVELARGHVHPLACR
jgi:hypothetical protein